MTRASKVMVVMVVMVLGLWGCSKGPANRAGQFERVQTLEGRCAKLEQDYRTAATARDQARKQAAALEEENAQLQKDLAAKAGLIKECEDLKEQVKTALAEREALRQQLAARTGERDEARQVVGVRTAERDTWHGRHDRFRKGLQSLLDQDEPQGPTAPANPSTGQPTIPTATQPSVGQS